MQRHDPAAICQCIIIGTDHAAFTGRNRLGRVKTEADRMSKATLRCSLADHAAFVLTGEGMRSIFDDSQPMSAGNIVDGI